MNRLRRTSESGLTIVEIAVFTTVAVPLLIALSNTVSVFSTSTRAAHHRANAASANQRVLQRIVGEVLQTTTRIDHPLALAHPQPHPMPLSPGAVNPAYDYVPGTGCHELDELHEVYERDDNETWHPVNPLRRFYIYATYEPFDTFEFQKILTPEDGSYINAAQGSVAQPWSRRRKIFLQKGEVLLRIEDPSEPTGARTLTLGSGVEKLSFHLNADGHVLVTLVTSSGRGNEGGGAADGRRVVSQTTINPRNGLN